MKKKKKKVRVYALREMEWGKGSFTCTPERLMKAPEDKCWQSFSSSEQSHPKESPTHALPHLILPTAISDFNRTLLRSCRKVRVAQESVFTKASRQ